MALPLQPYGRAKTPHTKCRVQGLRECSLNFVQKAHAIRDTVKRKYSLAMVQVDADAGGHGGREVFASVVVHKGELRLRAVQTP